MDHLIKYKLIASSQHGFTSGRLCLTNLLEYVEYVSENLDGGRPVDTILLDFSKAYWRLHTYDYLLTKILSISGEIPDWINAG